MMRGRISHAGRIDCTPAVRCLVSLTISLAVFACTDEKVIRPQPGGVGGSVSGRVVGADGPIVTRVRVESVSRESGFDSSAPRTLVTGETDADGRYSITAPPGDYRVGVDVGWSSVSSGDERAALYWRHDTLAASYDYSDTVHVEAGASIDSIDFALGAITVELAFAETMRDAALTIWAQREAPAPPARDYWSGLGFADAITSPITVRFKQVPPGNYRLRVAAEGPGIGEGQSLRLWLPSSLDETGAAVVKVTGGQRAIYAAAFTPDPLRIEGTVDGAWRGLGLDAPRVRAFTTDSLSVDEARCDAEGRFALLLPLRIPAKLRVDGSAGSAWFGGRDFGSATQFDPPSDGPISSVQFTDSAIEVSLVGPHAPTSARMLLHLYDDAGRRIAANFARWPSGDAVCSLLRPGTYRLRVVPSQVGEENWLAQWFDNAPDLEHATPIVISTTGEVLKVDVATQLGAKIVGHLYDPSGDLVSRAYVYVTPADERSLLDDGLSVGGGRYEVLGLATGTYRIGASPAGYSGFDRNDPLARVSRWYPNAEDWEHAATLTVAPPDSIEGVDLVLPWAEKARAAR